MEKKKIIIAGGSGFLGQGLAQRLVNKGYDAVILSRDPENYRGAGKAARWDGKHLDEAWVKLVDGAAAIVNLAGKNVNCRPSKENQRRILESRVDSVKALGEALRKVNTPPEIWIQAGSLAIYGDAGNRICDEAARVAGGFPANVCVAWEEELGRAVLPGTRWVNLRIGFVLGARGGALPFLAKLTRLGLGGTIGSGEQMISWIHLEDMLRIFEAALENPAMRGTYHASARNAVNNREMMKVLRRVLKRPWSPPAPAFAVRIGAPLLNSDPEIALTGRHCVPARLEAEGFAFMYDDFETAVRDLLTPDDRNLIQ